MSDYQKLCEVVDYCNKMLPKRTYKVTQECVISEIFVMNVYCKKLHELNKFQKCIYDKLKELKL